MTKLHILHSVQSSPSLLVNMQFLEVSRFTGLLRGPERHESRQHRASSGSLCLSRSSRGEHVDFRPTSKFCVAPLAIFPSSGLTWISQSVNFELIPFEVVVPLCSRLFVQFALNFLVASHIACRSTCTFCVMHFRQHGVDWTHYVHSLFRSGSSFLRSKSLDAGSWAFIISLNGMFFCKAMEVWRLFDTLAFSMRSIDSQHHMRIILTIRPRVCSKSRC